MERGIVMSKYLVKLMPLGKFFFGGDMTFKIGNKETAFSSYIIHSFTTPQQTSILGMMRFLILSNNDEAFNIKENRIKDQNKANALIGENGFTVCGDHKEVNYCSILRIGPCFMLDTQNRMPYFKASRDMDLQLVGESNGMDAIVDGMHFRIPDIYIKTKEETRHFTGKDYLSHYYRSLDGKDLKQENELFIEDIRVGINKNYSGKTENEAFYKQVSYRLKDNFCFAFEVEVSDSIKLTTYNKQVVKLGADDSSFVFEAEQINKNDYPVSENELKVVLLSDTYLPDVSTCQLRFAITEVRPFRFLFFKNNTNAQSYNVLNVIKDKSYNPAKRYDLYQAGSVFYFENKKDKEAFCRKIDSYAEFKQIGYNQYC